MSRAIKWALLASIAWIPAYGENLSAATIYADKTAFLAAAGTTTVATFEDVPVGQLFPFVSGGVLFSGAMQVVENLVSVPYVHWFGALGSPTHFVLFSPVSGGPGFFGLEAVFPADAVSGGFVFNCFGCDIMPNTSALDWETLDASGNTVEQGTVTVNLGGVSGQPPPGFFGLVTSKSFRSLRVSRRGLSTGTSGGNWMVDDVRYSAASAPITPPAAGIPTLNSAALLASAVMLLIAAYVRLRRAN